MKKNVTALILLTLSLTCCQQRTEKIEEKYLNKAIKEANVDSNYQWLVILPGLGCHGCMQEAEYFMTRYIGNEHILFVLTNISSLKILQQKIEVRIDEHTNIYVDRENLFDIHTNNRIYPCVVQLKDGKVFNHSFQSPQNDAFYQLKQQFK